MMMMIIIIVIIIIIMTHVECESKNDTRQYLSKIPGKNEIKELQKKKEKQPYWALHTYYGKG